MKAPALKPVKRKNLVGGILLAALVLCVFVWSNMPDTPYTITAGDDGVWDLRSFDFSQGNVRLEGLVQYIPSALLTPDEFETREQEVLIGRPEEAGNYATSKITILLPDDGYYSFSMPSADFSERLYVNGQWILDIGSPGETKEITVHDTATIRFTAKAENGKIEIVRQTASFLVRERVGTKDTTDHSGWLVGLPGSLRDSIRGEGEMALVAGCYFTLFLIHLMFYTLLHRYRANLCASLLCFVWFLRSGVIEHHLFSTLFPWMPWTVKLYVEYLSLPATAVLVLAIMHEMFPGIFKTFILYIVYGVSAVAVWAVLFLMDKPVLMSYALRVIQFVYALAIVYIVVMLVWRLRGARTEQRVYIAGMALMSVSLIWDMFFAGNNIYSNRYDSERAMLVFVFFAGLAVFMSTVRIIEAAKEQEQRLAAENAALDSANRLKMDLMATISHETRTPIAVISSYTELIAMELREQGVSERHAQDLDTVSDEIQHVGQLMEEMQGISRARDGAVGKTQTSLSDVINRTARLYRHILERSKTHLNVELPENLPTVYANPGEVTQVLLNLLKNAGNHTRDGTVTVLAQAAGSGTWIEVLVIDTGVGIAPELKPHVFDRGISGTENGTGIGLSVCQAIVKAHGGEIRIESEPDKGTAVCFTLPVFVEGDADA